MWNERYSAPDYVYGTEPNAFLAQQASRLQGPVLSLAEGEGRNAVHLAHLGLDVLGVDSSDVGLAKAQRLAGERGVRIATQVTDLAEFMPQAGHYGAVVSIFAHLPSRLRQRLYPLVEQALKPGGLLVLEAYTPRQIARGTGGPKDVDMLLDADLLRRAFPGLEPLLLQETERDVTEGRLHTGVASVVQFVGRKPG
ncbi:SAM-dependent methyltransferase [Amphibiibacter pelophylacis]|uniref:Class I SAM-dependent methyltransferase n=1 Tax=Amphibiibacter pelophylacis TaxID=1799477 RepID=A0ACC6P281_9BURK